MSNPPATPCKAVSRGYRSRQVSGALRRGLSHKGESPISKTLYNELIYKNRCFICGKGKQTLTELGLQARWTEFRAILPRLQSPLKVSAALPGTRHMPADTRLSNHFHQAGTCSGFMKFEPRLQVRAGTQVVATVLVGRLELNEGNHYPIASI